MKKQIYIETPRLILRQWKADDIPFMTVINQDKAVMRYFPALMNETDTRIFIKSCYHEIECKGYGYWAVERVEDKQLIGFVGLHKVTFASHFTPCVEISWRLHPDFWHMGYATEAAQACLQYGFNILKLDKIYSFTPLTNAPSLAVMKRLGMQYLGTFLHPNLVQHFALQEHIVYVQHAHD